MLDAINARVYLDESVFQNHETKIKHLFYVSAAIIPVQIEEQLTQRWRSLQNSILEVIRSSYLHGYKEFSKSGLELPEIHAVELCQSQKSFRKYDPKSKPPESDKYWERHLVWLQEAFEIQASFSIPVLVMGGKHDLYTSRLTDTIEKDLTPQGRALRDIENTLSGMRRLEASPYTWALPQIAFAIQSELKRRNWKADFICDEGENQKGFRASEMFARLHKTTLLNHLTPPQFLSSKHTIGLQVADIHAYCAMQLEAFNIGIQNPETSDQKRKIQFITGLAQRYTDRQIHLTNPQSMTHLERLAQVAIVMEFIIKNSGGPKETQDELWKEVQGSVERIANQFITSP
jgi:hypothetical protein